MQSYTCSFKNTHKLAYL